MAEYSFRGKRLDNGEWIYGSLVQPTGCINRGKQYIVQDISSIAFNEDGFQIGGFIEIDPDTVGQFTGLVDKGGNKIYEGDIVKTPEACAFMNDYEIVHYIDGGTYPFVIQAWPCVPDPDGSVIVGNIYDGWHHMTDQLPEINKPIIIQDISDISSEILKAIWNGSCFLIFRFDDSGNCNYVPISTGYYVKWRDEF